ncbi:MAG: hypothetical protein ACREJU_19215 [Nitrospiraceae bacterium]
MLRKHIVSQNPTIAPQPEEMSIPDLATVLVTSESPEHPIEHICDGRRGRGSTRWIAAELGDQTVVLAFDTPQTLHRITLEVEEPEVSRTQELTVAISHDGGQTYRECLRQEFHFSPPNTTFEREHWSVPAEAVTNVRLWIRPDKGTTIGRATITTLALQ